MKPGDTADYDAIVIGSGIGGALGAHPLVAAGWRVLMLERGDWVQRGPHNWASDGVKDLTPHYDRATPYQVRGDDRMEVGGVHCVGGQSVFYGGVSLRYRERDFEATPDEQAAGAQWPFDYSELESWYAAAERIIGVAGASGGDPTEPWRSTRYPQTVPPLSRTSCRVADAAERLGFSPFRLPLAINYARQNSRGACIGCNQCDCYACAVSAKNDVSVAVLPQLVARGMQLLPNTAVVRLRVDGRRVRAVECVDTRTGRRSVHTARVVILAAGALATPQLLLGSDATRLNPHGDLVGRMLMRHCNAIVFGVFPWPLDPAREFHKQIGINDLYFGHASIHEPRGRLGTIQQIHAPPPGLLAHALPGPLAGMGTRLLDRMTGLIVIANDAPQAQNRVTCSVADSGSISAAHVHHRYSARDRAARRALVRTARAVLHEAGALATITMNVRTFSHALGTVRMGPLASAAPLDAECRFRGIDNLFIADGSALPTSAGVNPSLTIAAVALRTGARLAGLDRPAADAAGSRITIIPQVIHA
ncbi:MAG TPA: GMC family oxidoreductase [Longimicrobiales bacterium]|nr:GMC family oxidoreductase [Longimicrobiales bacterium]